MKIPKLQLLCLTKIKLLKKEECSKCEKYLPPLLKTIFQNIEVINGNKFWGGPKKLAMKLLQQKDYPATCSGGFAVFSLKDTKKYEDIDIFTYVKRDECLKNVKKFLERKIKECEIEADIYEIEMYHDENGIEIEIGRRFCIFMVKNGRSYQHDIDFICLFTESEEKQNELANNVIQRGKQVCENFDLKICQVVLVQIWRSKFLIYRLSENVPGRKNLWFVKNEESESSSTPMRLIKYKQRVEKKFFKYTPENLVLVQNFVENCFT